jgi:hypothetical protein
MIFTQKANRRLVAPTTNLRASIIAYNLTNAEQQQYNRFNTNAMTKGLSPTEIPRSINASNLNRNTKKKLMHHWVRQYNGILAPNTIRNALRQIKANRRTRRLRR